MSGESGIMRIDGQWFIRTARDSDGISRVELYYRGAWSTVPSSLVSNLGVT